MGVQLPVLQLGSSIRGVAVLVHSLVHNATSLHCNFLAQECDTLPPPTPITRYSTVKCQYKRIPSAVSYSLVQIVHTMLGELYPSVPAEDALSL